MTPELETLRVEREGTTARVVLDRPGLNGCRLQVFSDEDQEVLPVQAVDSARNFLAGIRAQLDPDGLVNPHAWPLPAPGGGL